MKKESRKDDLCHSRKDETMSPNLSQALLRRKKPNFGKILYLRCTKNFEIHLCHILQIAQFIGAPLSGIEIIVSFICISRIGRPIHFNDSIS